MNILERLLKKRGIKNVDELSNEEKKDFENWRKILSKDELTLEDVKAFCQSQIDVIEGKWKDYSIPQSQKAEWIPYHTVYKTLEQAMLAPKSARENLEAQLNQLING